MQKMTPLTPGCYYHIYNRGNNREPIFFSDDNYRYFLKGYAEYISPVADTFAYCLLPNHFHILVQIHEKKEGDIKSASQQFANFFNSYTKSINKAYQRTGSLFEKRFGRILIESHEQLQWLVVYIHRNPQKHSLVTDFRYYRYSSYQTVLKVGNASVENALKMGTKIKVDPLLSWFGGVSPFVHAHEFGYEKDLHTEDLRGFQNLVGLDETE
jgi:REP element-mobilizing transposase RayT